MATTTAVYYRDAKGDEPADEFIDQLPVKPAAKIDDAIAEHLDGRDPSGPPAEFPATSQIDGELRELRVSFAGTQYRILHQRSGNLVVLLHGFVKTAAAVPEADKQKAINRMNDFTRRMNANPRRPPRAAGRDAAPRDRS